VNAGRDSSFVIFRLGAEQYGVPVESINSIIRYELSTPVPRSPQSVMGVINLRGRVIPVIDLCHRFSGVEFAAGPQSRIVVAETASGLVGLAVDEASEVVELPVESFRPIPEGVLAVETAKAFTGVVERDNVLIVLLDLDETVPRGVSDSGGPDRDGAGGDVDV
jgi:chemotaxis signal transduction protein